MSLTYNKLFILGIVLLSVKRTIIYKTVNEQLHKLGDKHKDRGSKRDFTIGFFPSIIYVLTIAYYTLTANRTNIIKS